MIHRTIEKISTRRLFGSYDYELFPSEAADESNRLLILYGDNGTGKTTILRVLFHLISPESRQGHKTTLVHIPLSRIRGPICQWRLGLDATSRRRNSRGATQWE